MAKVQTLLDMLGASPAPPRLTDAAVVIVDAQREYLDGRVPLTGINEALEEIQKLLKQARSANVPVFHVKHLTPNGAPVFAADSVYSEIIESVRPEGKEQTIVKHQPSSFIETNLAEQLKALGKQQIVLVGFMTHMCINATARGAVEHGFAPTIIGAACATRDLPGPTGNVIPARELHEANLASLSDLVACVIPSVSALR